MWAAPRKYLWVAIGPACAGLIVAAPGCKRQTPDEAAAVAPTSAETQVPTETSPSTDVSETPSPVVEIPVAPPVEVLPPGPNPTLPLSENSGSITGPISWVVAESSGAIATSPLIVLLHGRGDNPESFVRLAWRIAERLRTPVRFIAARAPHPVGLAQGRQWFDPKDGGPEASLSARLAEFDAFFTRLKAAYPEAPTPVVVGFSQGAMMALHLAFGRPGAIAGAAGLSGGLVAAPGAPEGQVPQHLPPVFVAAGAKDTIVGPERSWQAAEVLMKAGYPVTRFPFAGSHRIDDDELDALGQWLRPLVTPALVAPTPE